MSDRIPLDRAQARGYMRWWDRFYASQQETAPVLSRRELGQFLRRVEPMPGQTMIDVGCGRGNFATDVARLGVEVTGYDWSSVAINSARTRNHSRHARFVQHDFTAGTDPEGIQAGTVDIITCRLSLQYLDALAFLADARRWLRPGGTLYVVLPVNERQPEAKSSCGYPEATIEWLREWWIFRDRWDVDVRGAYTALALRHPLT